jgi:hypothetical protein
VSVLEEMPCQELVERVTEYLDASLLPDDRTRFESHLAECSGCEEILDQFRAAIDLTGRLRVKDVVTVDPGTREQLLTVFRSWRDELR